MKEKGNKKFSEHRKWLLDGEIMKDLLDKKTPEQRPGLSEGVSQSRGFQEKGPREWYTLAFGEKDGGFPIHKPTAHSLA